jgi:hypothetical protein
MAAISIGRRSFGTHCDSDDECRTPRLGDILERRTSISGGGRSSQLRPTLPGAAATANASSTRTTMPTSCATPPTPATRGGALPLSPRAHELAELRSALASQRARSELAERVLAKMLPADVVRGMLENEALRRSGHRLTDDGCGGGARGGGGGGRRAAVRRGGGGGGGR